MNTLKLIGLCLAVQVVLLTSVWAQEQKPELYVQTGHSYLFIKSVAYSKDGKILASGGEDTTIKLWDVETGQELRTLKGHTAPIRSVTFSPDGKTIASGSRGSDANFKLWNIETGKEIRTLEGHTRDVDSIAFTPNGKIIASGSWDGTIKLWNSVTGEVLKTLSQGNFVYSIAFSPDGKTLASGGSAGTTKLWNTETGQELKTITGNSYGILSVAFSPDGKILALGGGDEARTGMDNTIKLFNVETGKLLRTLSGHSDVVHSVVFTPDGKNIFSAGDDQTIKLWDVETGQSAGSLPQIVMTIAISPDGQTLVGGRDDNTIRLYNAKTGRVIRIFRGHTSLIDSLAISAKGNMVAASDVDKVIKIWDVETGQLVKTLVGNNVRVRRLAFSPDGKILVSVNYQGAMALWNTKTGEIIKVLDERSPEARTEVMALAPDIIHDQYKEQYEPVTKDGKFQTKRGENGKIDLYEARTGDLLCSLVSIDETDWAVVSPDGYFDGTPNAWKLLMWRMNDNTFTIAPIEAFFNEFYHPGLLTDIFVGRRIETPKRDISSIDIRQPEVKVLLSNANQNATSDTMRPCLFPPCTLSLSNQSATNATARLITINVEVKDAAADKLRATTSGARDVRLFRNGSLVKAWRGDVLKGQKSVMLEATIPIVAGENRITAYAFNHDNVKSSDATLVVTGADSLKRAGTAYVLAVGVNRYANPQYNLKYAVADAQDFAAEVRQKQEKLARYGNVEVTTLLDDEATKANILKALAQIAAKAQPEDAVVIYFAGHGTAQQKRFYLIPHDLGYSGERTALDRAGLETVLAHSISDRELETAVEGLDAGQMILIIDACNSGQALEAEEKRRGPMNSAGLAQLAYEKGMYILTAAQSFQEAKAPKRLGHGYLTYALVEEGLKTAAADTNKDKQVILREWLDFATQRVPQMQQEEGERRLLVQRQAGRSSPAPSSQTEVQHPRVFYRRETEAQPLVVARP